MKAKFFMLLPVLLLGLSFAGWGVMVSLAVSDPSFSVEPKYYQKAASFDDELRRRAASRALGWQVEVTEFRRSADGTLSLRARLTDRNHTPLAGVGLSVEAMANLRSQDVRSASSSSDEAGWVSVQLAAGAPGLWELRFVAERGTDEFSQVVRKDLAPGAS
jgi:nitrogen fixation protein FixH